MGKFIDMTGQRFGRLTALEPTDRRTKNNVVMWLCKCDCGKEVIIKGISVRKGHTKSCGCLAKEKMKAIQGWNRTHNQQPKRLYHIWILMKARCCNTNNPKFAGYGGRGIKVCDEWQHDFTAFRDWALSNGYADDLSIDRIDVNGNYEPGNCRWATPIEQAQNKRNNRIIEYEGERMCLAEYARHKGVKPGTAWSRYQAQKRKKGQTPD